MLIFLPFLFLSFIELSWTMECYVCKYQEANDKKCLSTVQTCGQNEDTCLTEIRWGSTPYWSNGALKQYYITKACSTKEACENRRKEFVDYCHRINYEDWKCAECCRGDRCNYYVVLGAPARNSSIFLILTTLLFILVAKPF